MRSISVKQQSLHRQTTRRVQHARRGLCVIRGSATTADKGQPLWTGDTMLSGVVNFVINDPILSRVMKGGAKALFKNSAQKAGVKWVEHVKDLEQTSEVYAIKKEIENPNVTYPDYYLKPFHAYDDGNLSWLAAFEVEPASYVQALRTFKTEPMAPQEAMDKMRLAANDCIMAYRQKHQVREVKDLIDVGCSIGISTDYLGRLFPTASLTGFDLSPFMLAVAELQERRLWEGQAPKRQRIKYVHGLFEESGLPAESYDVVMCFWVMHECPQAVIRAHLEEARRLVRPGGMVVFADNNPRSKTIQNLPPVIFTLMKSTEPWSDEYYSYDVEAGLREAGFIDVETYETDHRHRAVMARVP